MTGLAIRWRSPLRAAAVCLGLFLALLGAAWLGGGFAYSGTPLAPHSAPALSLRRDDGARFDLASLHGRAALVYFGYIHCPDVCPTTLASLTPVFQRLGSDASRVSVIFVTLDPGRDSVAALRAYLAGFEPVPLGLTGSPQAIAATARDWGVTWRKAAGGAFINHSSMLTLVGPDGTIRVRYGVSQLGNPAGMARDIRHVLGAG